MSRSSSRRPRSTGPGFLPRAIAVLGKWEPWLDPDLCWREVTSRAAAALALAEALAPVAPEIFLLSAEGHLRGQPRPGCLICAEILMGLGAAPRRIRCRPAANCTRREILALQQMAGELGVAGLLLVTSDYHVPRTRQLLARLADSDRRTAVVGSGAAEVALALETLDPVRRAVLTPMGPGPSRRRGRLSAVLGEALGHLALRYPALEQRVADALRGSVDPHAATITLSIDRSRQRGSVTERGSGGI